MRMTESVRAYMCRREREKNRRLSNAEERNRRGHITEKKKKELFEFELFQNKIYIK